MWTTLFSLELDDDILVKRIENGAFSIDRLLTIAEDITYDMIHSTFLEDPEEYLFCVMISKTDSTKKINEIIYTVTLEGAFYNKHIGKFIKEVRHKIINDLIVKFVTEMEKIDWRTIK